MYDIYKVIGTVGIWHLGAWACANEARWCADCCRCGELSPAVMTLPTIEAWARTHECEDETPA